MLQFRQMVNREAFPITEPSFASKVDSTEACVTAIRSPLTAIHKATSKPLVLIAFAEALSAPEVTWSLVDAGFEVLAFGRKGRRSALRYSRYTKVIEVTAPEIDARQTATDISSIAVSFAARNEQRPVLFLPLDDAALWLSAQGLFPSEWLLAGGGPGAAQLGLDKSFQMRTARVAGLQVPETTIVTTAAELLECSSRLPIILKPASAAPVLAGRLQKGRNWICANRDEFMKVVEAWKGTPPLLVQPFLRGVGEGVFGFATPRGVRAWSGHRRIRMMNPHGSGSSACVSRAVPDGLKKPVQQMVMDCGWRGLFMVEMLRDEQGAYWFIEFNGRAWGSLALSRRQGFEYPAWAVQQALNPEWEPQETGLEVQEMVCRNLGREIMHLLFVMRGRRSAAVQNWPSFWSTAAKMLRIGRRDSLYNFRRDDLRVFLGDSLCTIRENCAKRNKRA